MSEYVYSVAGVRVVSPQVCEGLGNDNITDLSVEVGWTEELVRVTDETRWVALPDPIRGAATRDGTRCVLLDVGSPAGRGWQVRQAVPFLASLQGAVVLHASAVRTHSGVHAFVAASGTGKSTLGIALRDAGLEQVADDLLPLRFVEGVHAMCSDSLSPLSGVWFLERFTSATPAFVALSGVDAMSALIHNGFGEMRVAEVWEVQFDAYHQVAQSVPCGTLLVPDDLGKIAATAAAVSRHLGRIDDPSPDRGR